MTKEDDIFWREFITAIIIFLSLIIGIIIVMLIDKKYDNKLWNNGHCPVCGSEWEYDQAVGHNYSTQYIYVCNKCGRRIEIGEIK